jgi:hypothetical protein
MLYIGGIAQQIDSNKYEQYQNLFYDIQGALLECGMIQGQNIHMTIDFSKKKCTYQNVDGSEPPQVVNIFHRNFENTKYSEEKFAAVQSAIGKFQSFCKELSKDITEKALKKVAVNALEGKVPAGKSFENIQVDLMKGTYTPDWDSTPRNFSSEEMSIVHRLQSKISQEQESIEGLTNLPDSTHPLGQVTEKVKILGQKNLSSCNWKNGCFPSRAYMRTDKIDDDTISLSARERHIKVNGLNKDLETQIRERAKFEIQIVQAFIGELEEVQKILECILGHAIKEVGTLRGSNASDEQWIKATFDEVIEQDFPEYDTDESKEIMKKKYEDFCVKALESYISKIKDPKSDDPELVLTNIQKAIIKGSQNGSFLTVFANKENVAAKIATVSDSPARDRSIFSRKHLDSWKEKWETEFQGIWGEANGSMQAGIEAIQYFEFEKINASLAEMCKQFGGKDPSILDIKNYLNQWISELKTLEKGSSSILQAELKKNQGRVLSQQTENEAIDPNVRQEIKEYRLLLDIWSNEVNEWVCKDYRHWISAGLAPNFLDLNAFKPLRGEIDPVNTSDQWDALVACFKHAKNKVRTIFGKIDPEKLQSLFNAFALLVPEGCDAQYKEFVLKESSRDRYTLPSGWEKARTILAKHNASDTTRLFNGKYKKKTTVLDNAALINGKLTRGR